MKTTVTLHDFRDAFTSVRPDNFSYAGLGALFTYLEEYEDSTGEEMEFDVIAICCDFTEYANIEAYNDDYEPVESIEEIEDMTVVIPIPGTDGFIIQQY